VPDHVLITSTFLPERAPYGSRRDAGLPYRPPLARQNRRKAPLGPERLRDPETSKARSGAQDHDEDRELKVAPTMTRYPQLDVRDARPSGVFASSNGATARRGR